MSENSPTNSIIYFRNLSKSSTKSSIVQKELLKSAGKLLQNLQKVEEICEPMRNAIFGE